MDRPKLRDSRFELLRLISALMIVAFHLSLSMSWVPLRRIARAKALIPQQSTLFYFPRDGWSLSFFGKMAGALFYQPYGKIGVALFVMISGYFLSQQDYSIKKSLRKSGQIYGQMIFYSLIVLVIQLILAANQLSPWGATYRPYYLLSYLFPFVSGAFWFVGSYIMLLLFLPFMKKTLDQLDKTKFIYLIVLTLLLGSLAVFGNENFSLMDGDGLGTLLPAFLAGYAIRKFDLHVHYKLLLTLVPIVLMYLLSFWRSASTVPLLPFISALAIFAIFMKIKPFYNPWINKLAKSALAIYLLHWGLLQLDTYLPFYYEHNLTARNFLILLVSVLTIGVTILIDQGRQMLFSKIKLSLRRSPNKKG